MQDTSPNNTGDKPHRLLVPFALAGAQTIKICRSVFYTLGGISIMLAQTFGQAFSGIFLPGHKFGLEALVTQMVRVGVRAIPIVIVAEMAIGVIMPLQMYPQLDQFGQAEQVATINAIAAFRELGPLITAVVLSGFAGASIAAELGSMVTAEEIEALRAMALNPIRFLVVPRLLATMLMTLFLTVIADIVMVVSGGLTGVSLGIDADIYLQMTLEAVNVSGFITGLVKGAIFGLLIGLIACYLGLTVKPWQGSEGVGQATTNTVVYSIVAIIGADAVFTVIFYSYGLFN